MRRLRILAFLLDLLICTLAGYFFGGREWVQDHFEAVMVAVVFISVLPMAVEFVLNWRRQRAARATAEAADKGAAAERAA